MDKIIEYLKEHNGVTFNTRTGNIVEASDGYFVSLQGYESIYTEPVTEKEIINYVRSNDVTLSLPGMFLGIWIDTETNNTYFDASLKVDDLERAIYVGMINNQKCIYDVAKNCIINVPGAQTAGTLTQQRSYNREKAAEVAREYLKTG